MSSFTNSLPKVDLNVLSKYARVELVVDLNEYSEKERKALLALRDAARIMDEVFLMQSTGVCYSEWISRIKEVMQGSEHKEEQEGYLRFFDINMGFWDRLQEDEEYNRKDYPKPKTLEYYPHDLTLEEWNEYLNPFENIDYTDIETFQESSVFDFKKEILDLSTKLDGENVYFHSGVQFRTNTQEPFTQFHLDYAIHNSTEWGCDMLFENGPRLSESSVLFAQGRLWQRTSRDQYDTQYANPSDAPLPFLCETKPSTSKLTKLLLDDGEEIARQKNWCSEYRKRGKNSETGVYELMISTIIKEGLGFPRIYFIEYADKKGIEWKIEFETSEIQNDSDTDSFFKVTPQHIPWLSPSIIRKEKKDLLDRLASGYGHSLYCGIPFLF